jgi:hypothetical protein
MRRPRIAAAATFAHASAGFAGHAGVGEDGVGGARGGFGAMAVVGSGVMAVAEGTAGQHPTKVGCVNQDRDCDISRA